MSRYTPLTTPEELAVIEAAETQEREQTRQENIRKLETMLHQASTNLDGIHDLLNDIPRMSDREMRDIIGHKMTIFEAYTSIRDSLNWHLEWNLRDPAPRPELIQDHRAQTDGGYESIAEWAAADNASDTTVSGYSFGPEPAYPSPDGYWCPSCSRLEGETHGPPCEMEDHDLELIAAEMAERWLPDTTYRVIDTGITITIQKPGTTNMTLGTGHALAARS